MDTKTNDMPIAGKTILALQKKQECLNLIAEMLDFFQDVGDRLYERAERTKIRFYLTSLTALPLFGVFLFGVFTDRKGFGWTAESVITTIAVFAGAILATMYERRNKDSMQYDERIKELYALHDCITDEPAGAPSVAAWFVKRYRVQIGVLRKELTREQVRYPQYVKWQVAPHVAAPVGDADKLHDTITEVEKAVSGGKLTDAQAAVAVAGVASAITSLN